MLILSYFKCLILHLHFEIVPLKITNVNRLLGLYILNKQYMSNTLFNRLCSLKHYKYQKH
jgi:hypothetical protein